MFDYFIVFYLASKRAIASLSNTKRCIQLTRVLIGEASFQFPYLFKIGKERGGQESYYFVLLCLASKGALVLFSHTKRCVQLMFL